MVFQCIFLFTNQLLSMILSFHVSSTVKCLFMFSAHFSIGLSFFLMVFKAFLLYTLDAHPWSVICYSDLLSLFSLSYHCHGDLMSGSS